VWAEWWRRRMDIGDGKVTVTGGGAGDCRWGGVWSGSRWCRE
jgi:hypothetical protein